MAEGWRSGGGGSSGGFGCGWARNPGCAACWCLHRSVYHHRSIYHNGVLDVQEGWHNEFTSGAGYRNAVPLPMPLRQHQSPTMCNTKILCAIMKPDPGVLTSLTPQSTDMHAATIIHEKHPSFHCYLENQGPHVQVRVLFQTHVFLAVFHDRRFLHCISFLSEWRCDRFAAPSIAQATAHGPSAGGASVQRRLTALVRSRPVPASKSVRASRLPRSVIYCH